MEDFMSGYFLFLFNSACLGVGLAMDAFSVSLANGLHDPGMSKKRMCGIAGTFAGFQFLMPMIGWVCVHTIVQYFRVFEKFIPWIALILLLYIGGSMLIGAFKKDDGEEEEAATGLGFWSLMMQGVATSIDALSVGFTIADYGLTAALTCALIVAVVTFVICYTGLELGKKFGTRFSNKAEILGGVILIAIGLEIFITGVFF
jgi:putative Mn2+ efflux pump MntP